MQRKNGYDDTGIRNGIIIKTNCISIYNKKKENTKEMDKRVGKENIFKTIVT